MVYYLLFVPTNALWRTSQDGTLRNMMHTARLSSLLARTLDTPKQGKSITSISINLLHFHSRYNFIIILHINSLQTFETHMQPLPRFINCADFIVQRSTALYNFDIP